MTHSDDVIKSGETLMRIDDKPWCCKQDVEFKTFAEEAELENKSWIWCPFSEARPSLYTWGNAERLSNISEINSDCYQWVREIPESSFSEQHDESDDNPKRKWVIKRNQWHIMEIRIEIERWLDPMNWLNEEWGLPQAVCEVIVNSLPN